MVVDKCSAASTSTPPAAALDAAISQYMSRRKRVRKESPPVPSCTPLVPGTPLPSGTPLPPGAPMPSAYPMGQDAGPPLIPAEPNAKQPRVQPPKDFAEVDCADARESTPVIKFSGDLEEQVERCYRKVAGNGKLDVEGVRQLRNMLMQELGLPQQAFGQLETQLLRFDLDGDRCLDMYEVFQCVKMNVYEYSKMCRQGSHDITIPCSSLKAAGFNVGKELGHGSQGQAYVGQNAAGEFRCIKRYSKNGMGKTSINCLQDEYNVLHNLTRHPNAAFAFDIFQDRDSYFMILELYSGGDFTSLACHFSRSSQQMDAQWWRALFKQCFLGLAHMHENGLMHCDIKEPNLMLRDDNYQHPQVVIIDFGLVRTAACDESRICGTPGYIAPETWQFWKLFPRSDVFSMGVVMMQMLLNRVPTADGTMPDGIFTNGCKDVREVQTATLRNVAPFHELPSRLCSLTKVLQRVLYKDVECRPCAKQVLQEL